MPLDAAAAALDRAVSKSPELSGFHPSKHAHSYGFLLSAQTIYRLYISVNTLMSPQSSSSVIENGRIRLPAGIEVRSRVERKPESVSGLARRARSGFRWGLRSVPDVR